MHLNSLGINVLHNSNRQIPSEGDPKEQLCMAGVDDIEADRIMWALFQCIKLYFIHVHLFEYTLSAGL